MCPCASTQGLTCPKAAAHSCWGRGRVGGFHAAHGPGRTGRARAGGSAPAAEELQKRLLVLVADGDGNGPNLHGETTHGFDFIERDDE